MIMSPTGLTVNADPSSRHTGCYMRTTTASVQLENRITGRESQGVCRQEELIGGKLTVLN
jgi:hypothetical protein